MRRPLSRVAGPDRGAALPLVLVILAVLGALAGRLVVIGLTEQRMARATREFAYASAAAQEGLALRVAAWDESLTRLSVGDSASFRGTVPTMTAWYHGWVVRLSDVHYLISAVGRSAGGPARARFGLLVQVEPGAKTPQARPLGSRPWILSFE